MVNDAEAREAVRELIKRFDFIVEQGAGLAYVVAKGNRQEYVRLLESAERAVKLVLKPMTDGDTRHKQVFAALDDPDADWPKAVFAMLNQGPTVWSGEKAAERLNFYLDLEARFDAEERDTNKEE